MLSLYIFQVCRLYDTFKETQYKISLKTICFLVLLIILAAITSGLSFVEYFIDATGMYGLFISHFLFAVLPCIVTFLFAKKLYKVLITMRQSIAHEIAADTKAIDVIIRTNSELTERQTKLLETITKQALLSTFEISFLIGLAFIWLIMSIMIKSNETNTFLWDLMLGIDIIGAFSVFIGLYCVVWLSFSFANKEYNYLCVKCKCHGCYFTCFEKIATKSIRLMHLKTVERINKKRCKPQRNAVPATDSD